MITYPHVVLSSWSAKMMTCVCNKEKRAVPGAGWLLPEYESNERTKDCNGNEWGIWLPFQHPWAGKAMCWPDTVWTLPLGFQVLWHLLWPVSQAHLALASQLCMASGFPGSTIGQMDFSLRAFALADACICNFISLICRLLTSSDICSYYILPGRITLIFLLKIVICLPDILAPALTLLW